MKKQAFQETLLEFFSGIVAFSFFGLAISVPYFLISAIPRFIKETDRIPISAKEDYLAAYFSTLIIIFVLVVLLILFYVRYREHLDELYAEEIENNVEVDSECEEPLKEEL